MVKKKPSPYSTRDKLLLTLGYSSYRSYLYSDLWSHIRALAFSRYKRKCRMCGKKASHLHHRSYSKLVLLGKNLKPLVPLCKSCHHFIEFTSSGNKRSFTKVNKLLSRHLLPLKRKRR